MLPQPFEDEDQGQDQSRSSGGASTNSTPRSSFTSNMFRKGSLFQKKGGTSDGDTDASASTNGAGGSTGNRSRSGSRDGKRGSTSFMPNIFSKPATKEPERRKSVLDLMHEKDNFSDDEEDELEHGEFTDDEGEHSDATDEDHGEPRVVVTHLGQGVDMGAVAQRLKSFQNEQASEAIPVSPKISAEKRREAGKSPAPPVEAEALPLPPPVTAGEQDGGFGFWECFIPCLPRGPAAVPFVPSQAVALSEEGPLSPPPTRMASQD